MCFAILDVNTDGTRQHQRKLHIFLQNRLAYFALQISTSFSGFRGNPFSARVAAISCVCRSRKLISLVFFSAAFTASGKVLLEVTVYSNSFMCLVSLIPQTRSSIICRPVRLDTALRSYNDDNRPRLQRVSQRRQWRSRYCIFKVARAVFRRIDKFRTTLRHFIKGDPG